MGYQPVALSSSSEKEALVAALGASRYLDSSKVDQAQELQKLGGDLLVCRRWRWMVVGTSRLIVSHRPSISNTLLRDTGKGRSVVRIAVLEATQQAIVSANTINFFSCSIRRSTEVCMLRTSLSGERSARLSQHQRGRHECCQERIRDVLDHRHVA